MTAESPSELNSKGDKTTKNHRFRAVILAALSISTLGCAEDLDDSVGQNAPHGTAAPGATAVNGVVKEWKVLVDRHTIHAGQVTFTVANEGTIGHEFLVVRTDSADGAIPIEGDGFSENNPSLLVIKEIGEFPIKTIQELTVTLEPGSYQLVCNLPSHYGKGMHTSFTVVK